MKSDEMYIFVDSGTGMLAVGISGGLTDKKCEARAFTNKNNVYLRRFAR